MRREENQNAQLKHNTKLENQNRRDSRFSPNCDKIRPRLLVSVRSLTSFKISGVNSFVFHIGVCITGLVTSVKFM